MAPFQDLVDGLAERLGRPILVSDRQMRGVGYSSHADDVIDSARRRSILQRAAPVEVGAWLAELGIFQAHAPMRVPVNDGFGMVARVCVPLRFDGRLLGFIWLIDGPEPLTDAEIDAATSVADEMAVALYSASALEQSEREEDRRLKRAALGLLPGDPAEAAAALQPRGLLVSSSGVAVAVLCPRHETDRATDLVKARLVAAADHERRHAGLGRLLTLVDADRVFVVFAFEVEADLDARITGIASRLQADVADLPGWSLVMGASARHDDRARLSAAREEAERAAKLAAVLPELDGVGRWDRLGAYRTLVRLLGDADPSTLVSQPVLRLIEHAEADQLVPTLSTYLDLGGDARGAAEALFLHRSSLYHRLHRIERITGADLGSGDDRLELHLGLRLWRLAGEPGTAAE